MRRVTWREMGLLLLGLCRRGSPSVLPGACKLEKSEGGRTKSRFLPL